MKLGAIAMIGMSAVTGLMAAEINSKVIHDYNYFSLGYGYLHDIADADVDGHGPVGEVSFEQNNFVLNVSGGYFWVTDTGSTDINLWDVSASVGYALRLMNNHLNIIPRFGGAYSGIQVDDSAFGDESDETWSILPGISLSYAPCNRFAINGGYTYVYNFDAEDEDNVFHAGAQFGLLEQIGLSVNANFSKEFGFTGITAVVEFHY
jgi:hypothetical protein